MSLAPAYIASFKSDCVSLSHLRFKIASTAAEFEAIHRLNHATFAVEIPQHPRTPDGRLVDRFHDENTYAVCVHGDTVIGMVAGRCRRPFSLDQKLTDLHSHLPAHRKAVEIRLLAVVPAFRKTAVFVGLVRMIAQHFVNQDCDLGVISGTVRQAKLYRHLGFRPFADAVGTADARYQPMFVTLETFRRRPLLLRDRAAARGMKANFLPGPVGVTREVLRAYARPPISHRDSAFLEALFRVRAALTDLVAAREVVLLVGSGTLGNDAVGAQLRCLEGPGLIITNGEFGERLVDHARRWDLNFATVTHYWGQPYVWSRIEATAAHCRPKWVWAVLCETSTGVRNSKDALLGFCARIGADLCLDAVSAIGLFPVDLQGVHLATAVSGKGLAALPGLVAVFHDGRIETSSRVPRYLDLARYEQSEGTPFTHSSNLVAALECSLTQTEWPTKFERVRRASHDLWADLRALGLAPVAAEPDAAPGIVTIALPSHVTGRQVATSLSAAGIQIAWASEYLQRRNWVQICLMGEFDRAAVRSLPRLLADAVDPPLELTRRAMLS
jgi:aspartate aminotransferase-like enzyme